MSKDKFSGRKRQKPPTNAEIHEAMHQEALGAEGVMELGPTTPKQGALFEQIRTGITHGHVLISTFDAAVKKRHLINHERDRLPRKVDEATFDADIEYIKNLPPEKIDSFDTEVCNAEMITRHETGGVMVWPDRASGFGRDVFGIAYDAISGRWTATNEMGLHAHCEDFLRREIRFENPETPYCILSGLIFQLHSIQTPVMIPFGYYRALPKLLKKATEELWMWKRFILLTDVEIAPRKRRYKQLFTPEYAAAVLLEQK